MNPRRKPLNPVRMAVHTKADAPKAAQTADASSPDTGTDTGWHPAISAGIGVSHDIIGLGLELRRGHVGAAVGLGLPLLLGHASLMGSVRYFPTGASGLVLALNGGRVQRVVDFFFITGTLYAVSVTASYRWTLARWFGEAGVGPAVGLIHNRGEPLGVQPFFDVHLVGGYEF